MSILKRPAWLGASRMITGRRMPRSDGSGAGGVRRRDQDLGWLALGGGMPHDAGLSARLLRSHPYIRTKHIRTKLANQVLCKIKT
jgi:hypothetical protein